jgi:hypothetical protein
MPFNTDALFTTLANVYGADASTGYSGVEGETNCIYVSNANGLGLVRVHFATTPTSGQITAVTALVAAWVPVVPATMFQISPLVFALTTTQQNEIITNLFGGSPPLYWLTPVPQSLAMASIYACSSPFGTLSRNQQLIMIAIYVTAFPNYLVNPTFDISINVSGYVPA